MVTRAGRRRVCLVEVIMEASGRVGAVGLVGEVARGEYIIFVELFRGGGGRRRRIVGWRRVGINAEESVCRRGFGAEEARRSIDFHGGSGSCAVVVHWIWEIRGGCV